ncbi:homeobox protein NANOG-like [Pleurodeles waltl]|uniref:homeobox protein NANOG-like n=1 Tax=Pleurodeles waltl TaxID=8319 RepID=UPI003709AA5F
MTAPLTMPADQSLPGPNPCSEERPSVQSPPGAPLGPETGAPVPAGKCCAPPGKDGALYPPPDSATGLKVESSTQLSPVKASGPEKKVRKRTYFTQEQLMELHQRFQKQHYMNVPQAQQLAKDLNLTYQQVKTWFQNRRMKHKKIHKESLWINQGQRLLQTGSQSGECIRISPPFSQGCQAHHGGNLQRFAGHPYQNYASMQSPHQTIVPEDRPLGLHRQSILQSLGQQQSMDMFQNYQAMEYPSSRQGDGYNFTPPQSYPSGAPYTDYFYQQQQLHCNHYQSMSNRKYENTEENEPNHSNNIYLG